MEYGWGEEFEGFRQEARAFLEQIKTPALVAEVKQGLEAAKRGPELQRLQQEVEDRGWRRMSWPTELGGEGKSPWYTFILMEEFARAELPYQVGFASMVAPAIQKFGTDAQREKWLAALWSGEVTVALGYSEPNAGTDLASLETLSVRDGDEWVINGQKLWTSGANSVSHIWLAARTDPEAPKHKGISMFIVPTDADGITIRGIETMGSGRTNEVFFEDVHVPGDALVGEVNQGWYILANALDHERVGIGAGANMYHTFDRLVAHLREKRPALLQDRRTRMRIAELDLDLAVMNALVLTNASIVATGETPTMEASMSKVWTTELRYRLASLAMDLLGREGALTKESDGAAPFEGELENTYRVSPIQRFGGGTNEVMRDIIARRGLGLPR